MSTNINNHQVKENIDFLSSKDIDKMKFHKSFRQVEEDLVTFLDLIINKENGKFEIFKEEMKRRLGKDVDESIANREKKETDEYIGIIVLENMKSNKTVLDVHYDKDELKDNIQQIIDESIKGYNNIVK